MKKSTHSKIKNTAILFELLSRQVAADTIKGVEKSPALSIIKEFFKADSVLAKELMLYQTLLNEKYSNTEKANYLLNTVIKLRNKLDANQLREQKYNLIREIKKYYDLTNFFKTNISEYKIYASTYRVFEGVSVAKVSEVVQSRYTILEHLVRKPKSKINEEKGTENYLAQDSEIRLLAYKLMIDKFNEKYADLSIKQKNILKEYINNMSNTTKFKDYLAVELPQIVKELKTIKSKISDKVTTIKLSETISVLEKMKIGKTVTDNNVSSIMLSYELIKELKSKVNVK